jgi:inorganic pyrophosphatase
LGAFRLGEKMDDKILEVKKEMMRIAKMKDLSRMERYELAKRRSERLSESERRLLIEECQRDYESYDRIGDIRELFTFFFAGISMILSVFAIFANNKDVSVESLASMLLMLLLFVVVTIAVIAGIQIWRGSGLNITKYMIDVLKDLSI